MSLAAAGLLLQLLLGVNHKCCTVSIQQKLSYEGYSIVITDAKILVLIKNERVGASIYLIIA